MFIYEKEICISYPESIEREYERLEKIGIPANHLVLKGGLNNDNDSIIYDVEDNNEILISFNHVVFIEPILLSKVNNKPLTFISLINGSTVILDIIFTKFIEKYNLLGGH